MRRSAHADELVPEDATKTLVAANQLQIGFADARPQYAHEDVAGRRLRIRSIGLHPYAIVSEHQRAHPARLLHNAAV